MTSAAGGCTLAPMCYSAQIQADYRSYVRAFGADISIREFVDLYWARNQGENLRIPKAMDTAFMLGDGAGEVRTLIEEFNAAEAGRIEEEMLALQARLDAAEAKLQKRVTKTAENDRRIATDKLSKARTRLADLGRTELKARDARIYPGSYAPVMVWEDGRKVVKPMRYQCRPEGKPAFYDRQYPGTYNARRDNLEGFWKKQFGHTHGVLLVTSFFENVEGPDGKNQVLEFTPDDGKAMIVACLWSRWTGKDGEELLSFAAITDEPPAEVAAAGHDRCIIQLRSENVDAWLQPDPANLAAAYAILDDRDLPHYSHQEAA